MRRILFILLSLCLSIGIQAKKESKTELVTVYLYGMSSSFRDSVVYMTDIQKVDGAYLLPKGLLGGLSEYVSQMNTHFAKQGFVDEKKRINTVFFKTTRKKAEKAYLKLRKRYQNSAVILKPLPESEFIFKTIAPSYDEPVPQENSSKTVKKAKKDQKKANKSKKK